MVTASAALIESASLVVSGSIKVSVTLTASAVGTPLGGTTTRASFSSAAVLVAADTVASTGQLSAATGAIEAGRRAWITWVELEVPQAALFIDSASPSTLGTTTESITISATAALPCVATVTTLVSEIFVIAPVLVGWQTTTPVVLALIGTGTNWTTATTWVSVPVGSSIASESFLVSSTTSATWTLMFGPGVGTISLSDGLSASILILEAFTLSTTMDLAETPVTVTLTGTNTQWSNTTTWTLGSTGAATLSNSSIVVNSPTSATWAFTPGPGGGFVSISDGIAQAAMQINPGGPVVLGAATTLSEIVKITSRASLTATSTLTILASGTNAGAAIFAAVAATSIFGRQPPTAPASPAGTALITAVGSQSGTANELLSAAALLATSQRVGGIVATLVATASLVPAGVASARSTLSATTSVSALGAQAFTAQAALTSTSVMSATGTQAGSDTATLSATAQLTQSIALGSSAVSTATASLLTSSAGQQIAAAACTAAGAITTVVLVTSLANQIVLASALLTASNAVAASVSLVSAASALASGAQAGGDTSTLSSSGTLAAVGSQSATALAALSAAEVLLSVGSLSVTTTLSATASMVESSAQTYLATLSASTSLTTSVSTIGVDLLLVASESLASATGLTGSAVLSAVASLAGTVALVGNSAALVAATGTALATPSITTQASLHAGTSPGADQVPIGAALQATASIVAVPINVFVANAYLVSQAQVNATLLFLLWGNSLHATPVQ